MSDVLPLPPLPVPPPVPSAPTMPKLTAEMVSTAKEKGLPAPAAGGWSPKILQTLVISSAIAGLAAVLDLLGAEIMEPKAIAIAFGKAALAFAIAQVGQMSAGPRKVRP